MSAAADPHAAPAERRPFPRGVARAILALTLAFLGFLAVRQALGLWHLRGLTSFAIDDEGYVLISLRAFARGGVLYDDVYTQYGPAFYFLVGLPLRWFGVVIDHDWSRAFTFAEITVIAACLAGTVWRHTRSVLAAALTLVLVRPLIVEFYVEPSHPHGLAWVVTAVILLASARPSELGARAWIAIGALVGVIACIKLNVGLIVGAGLVAGAIGSAPRDARARWRWWLASAALCAVPFLVLHAEFTRPWMQGLVALATGAVIARTAVASRARASSRVTPRAFAYLAAGAAVSALVFVGALVVSGTSVAGVAWGLVLQHAPMLVEVGEARVGEHAFTTALAGAGSALVWCLVQRWRPRVAAVLATALALAWGALTAYISCASDTVAPALWAPLIQWCLPFAWVALACPRRSSASAERDGLPWVLGGVASFEVLQCYPVAGVQLAWVVFLLAPLAVITVFRAVAVLVDALAARGVRTAQLVHAAAGLAAGVWAFRVDAQQAVETEFQFGQHLPVNLHGAACVRANELEDARFRWLTDTTRVAGPFYSSPALNSVYFMSETEPLTNANGTYRPDLFHPQQRQRIEAALEAAPRLFCLFPRDAGVVLRDTAQAFENPTFLFPHRCVPAGRWDTNMAFVREGTAPVWVSCARIEDGAVVLRTGCSVAGIVSALEVRSLRTYEVAGCTWFGALAEEQMTLADARGAEIELPSALLFAEPVTVVLRPRDPVVLERARSFEGTAVRLLGAHGEYVQSFPLILD